jgi:hypothetical protein
MVNDQETSADNLGLLKASGNPDLAPPQAIVFDGTGSSRTARITPAPDQYGSALITISVTDGLLIASTSFTMTVEPVNDAPLITGLVNQTTDQDQPLTVNFILQDVDHALTNLVLSADSSNPTLVSAAGLALGGSDGNRNLTITPEPDQSGSTLITVSATDSVASASNSFTLIVNSLMPLGPTDIRLTPNRVPENSPAGYSIGTLTAVDPDSAVHTFELVDSAGERFSIMGDQLVVGNGAVLDFETASGHEILVTARDPEMNTYTKTLSIEVDNLNEAPVLMVEDPSLLEAVGGFETPITRLRVSDPDSGTNDITLTLEVSQGTLQMGLLPPGSVTGNGTSTLIVNATVAELNATLASIEGLRYQPNPGLSGMDLLSTVLNDNGHSGSGVGQTVSSTLGIRFYRDLYDQWLHQEFTQAELDDLALETTLWGYHADFDQDRFETVAEYGLGFSPKQNNEDRQPLARIVGEEGFQYLSMTVDRRKDPNLTLVVEVSGDLNDGLWSSAPSDLDVSVPLDLGNSFERLTYSDRNLVGPDQKRFMRIRWELQPTVPSP